MLDALILLGISNWNLLNGSVVGQSAVNGFFKRYFSDKI
jgi:hypothetical protein